MKLKVLELLSYAKRGQKRCRVRECARRVKEWEQVTTDYFELRALKKVGVQIEPQSREGILCSAVQQW